MNLNDTKSSETLRKEISRDLDRLDSKVDQLKERLTPGQVLDNAVFSSYRGNPRATFNYLKRNPVGTTFLALGTLLLMDNEGESYEEYLRGQSKLAYQDYREKLSRSREELSGRIDHLSQEVRAKTQSLVEQGERGLEKVRSRGRDLKEQVSSSTENLKDKLSRSKEEVKDNVIDATETFKERSTNVAESSNESVSSLETMGRSKINDVKNSVSEFSKSAVDMLKEKELDSLSYVALGGAMGFATGGLIPISDEEIDHSHFNFDIGTLRSDLEKAANESANLFKNELVEALKNTSIDIF